MAKRDKDTEQVILDAAIQVFTAQGYAGAQMQSIADTAGINKALVHYYFRSKQQLFDRVFETVLKTLMDPLLSIFEKDIPIIEKIELFINSYVDTLIENPYLALFMLHELSANKEVVQKFFKHDVKGKFGTLISELVSETDIISLSMDPRQMIVNFMSMLLFPFVGRALITQIFDLSTEQYNDFLASRKKILLRIIKERLNLKND